MPPDPSELLAKSETLYLAGALKDAIEVLRNGIDGEDFVELAARDQAAVRLQLGKLLVTAIFMDGADPLPAREQMEVARSLGDARQRATTADLMGLSHYYEQLARERPDLSEARAEFEVALKAREAWADPRELSESHFHLGMVAQLAGNTEAALDRYRRAYDLAKQGGHKVEQSFAIRHLGFLHRSRGELQAAYEAMAESLRLRQEVEMTVYLPFSHLALADAALALAKSEEAERHYRLAEESARRTGNKRAQLLSALGLGRLHRSREDWDSARMSFLRARDFAEEIGHQVAFREALEALESLPRQKV